MKRTSLKRRTLGKSVLALAFGLASLFCAGHASAGCGSFGTAIPSPVGRDTPAGMWDSPSGMALTSAVYRPGSERLIRVSDDNDRHSAGIVGMRRFNLVSDGNAYPTPIPFRAPIDFGTQQWHDDGTEFLISGGRPPEQRRRLYGRVGENGAENLPVEDALAYVSSDSSPPVSPATFLGPAVILETVVLSPSGKGFAGTFTIDQYAKDEITLIEHISGTVTATRFTVD